jgi:trigger factor
LIETESATIANCGKNGFCLPSSETQREIAMKVTQEKLPASQIGLEIEVPPEASKQAYEKTIQDFIRHASIPGFRKGKVPRQVVIQKFGAKRIKATVLEELVQDSLRKAVEQEKIEAIGQFQLRSDFDVLMETFEPGSPIVFSAAVDVPPQATLNTCTGLTVQAEEIKHDETRVDKVLEDYRKRSATLVPVEGRGAQEEDMATVDFTGKLNGAGRENEEIPGGSATDFQIELSEGRFIPGFVEGVIGMAIGETKDVEATFPEGYPQEDLAGQPAIFTITVKELKERELPELDDDFAQDISEFETLEELKNSLEERYQKEASDRTKSNKQEALLTELIKHVEVDLPDTMIRQEVDYSITQTAMQLSQQGMDIKKMFTSDVVRMLRDQARPEAINRLMRTMALGEIAKQQSIKVLPAEITDKAQELIQQYSDQELDMDRVRQVVEEDLLKDKILDWLEENNTVELVPEGTLKKDDEDDEAAILEAVAEVEAIAADRSAGEQSAGEQTVEAKATEVAEVAEISDETDESDDLSTEKEEEKPKKTSKIPAAKTGESAKKAKSSPKPTKSPSKSDPK